MCTSLFGGSSAPSYVPAPIAPSPAPLRQAEESIRQTKASTRRKAAALASLPNTNLTSPLGLGTMAQTTSKSLLGQ